MPARGPSPGLPWAGSADRSMSAGIQASPPGRPARPRQAGDSSESRIISMCAQRLTR